MKPNDNPGERHPLEPFLPENARLLMLGSFPPQRHRWSMEFFYPNLQNDMWRIVGYLATGDKTHFLMPDAKRFDKERIEQFCRERGIDVILAIGGGSVIDCGKGIAAASLADTADVWELVKEGVRYPFVRKDARR